MVASRNRKKQAHIVHISNGFPNNRQYVARKIANFNNEKVEKFVIQLK
jgi:hypothetical protein